MGDGWSREHVWLRCSQAAVVRLNQDQMGSDNNNDQPILTNYVQFEDLFNVLIKHFSK